MTTFSIAEPYPRALCRVRRALIEHGLRAPIELDIAASIRQKLGAGVAPCTIFYVDDVALTLEALVFHRGAALGIPQPVVVSGSGPNTEVFIQSMNWRTERNLPPTSSGPLRQLHERIEQALQSIATRDAVLTYQG